MPGIQSLFLLYNDRHFFSVMTDVSNFLENHNEFHFFPHKKTHYKLIHLINKKFASKHVFCHCTVGLAQGGTRLFAFPNSRVYLQGKSVKSLEFCSASGGEVGKREICPLNIYKIGDMRHQHVKNFS